LLARADARGRADGDAPAASRPGANEEPCLVQVSVRVTGANRDHEPLPAANERRRLILVEATDMSVVHEHWTSERVELLKHWFNAGLSCSQIAGQIGATRNAVIGKLHRLGLSRPQGVGASRLEPRDPSRPKAMRRKPWCLSIHAQREMLRAVYPGASGQGLTIESPHKCSLLELDRAQCRWPISEPGAEDFGFCGNRSVDGLSYCAGHALIAYRGRSRQSSRGGGIAQQPLAAQRCSGWRAVRCGS
jgi:GcrA cell cycle regulator